MSRRHVMVRFISALFALCLAAACSSGGDGSGEGDDPQVPELEAPTRAQLAEDVRVGDQSDQTFNTVAAHEGDVVAAGFDYADNVQRAMFATSKDAGRTWRRGTVDVDTIPEGVGNSTVADVAAGDDGFVAVGWREDGQPALWRSADGNDWQLQDAEAAAFEQADWTDAVTWADGRYYVVGGNSKAVGRSSDRLVVWTSEDGATWRRNDLSDALRDVVGTPSASDIAVAGNRVLIAGGVEDNEKRDQPNRIALWLSTDGGRSFDQEQTITSLAGDYRAYAAAVYVDGGEFHIAAAGDGRTAQQGQSSWDSVVVTRRYGGWTTVVDPAMSSPQDEQPSTLFRVGDRWVFGTNISGDRDDAAVYAGGSYEHLGAVKARSLRGIGEQIISDGTSVDGAGLFAGSTSRSGSMEPAIWRLTGQKLKRVKLPTELSGGDPTVLVDRVVSAGDTFVGVGEVANSPVAWSSSDFTSWQPTGLEGKDDYIPDVQMADAVSRRDGSVLAVGHRSRGHGDDALVWIRDPSGKWHQKRSTELAERGAGGYGSIVPAAVAVKGQVAVMAADFYTDGSSEIHPMFSRDAGVSWEAADGSRKASMTSGDDYANRTEWLSFRSPVNGSVGTTSVAKSGKVWAIGGHRSEAGSGPRPTVWLSRNAATWTMPRALPMPPKAYGSSVVRLVARGDTFVAIGTVTRSESDQEVGWVSWTSSDGGRTWRLGPSVEDSGHVSDLLVIDDGLVALGGLGSGRAGDAQAWVSSDGRAWKRADLGLSHGGGRGRQIVLTGVVDGDRLRVLVMDTPPEGGGIYAETAPLPSP